MNFEKEESEIKDIESEIDYLTKSRAQEQKDLGESAASLERSLEAQEILQLVSRAVQQKAHERISQVVTRCLSAVFGEDAYEFQILFEMRRGKTEAILRFVRDGISVDPLTASGGGVVDVAAFALRIACLILHRPRLSPVLIMDEPFKFVSQQYQENVRVMLEELSEELKIQIIMVTHNMELATGKIITLK